MNNLAEYGITKENQHLWRTIFNTEAGQKALGQLEDFCNVYNTCHIPGDPYSTAYNEGQRSVAIFIRQMLETDLTNLDQPAEDEDYGESGQPDTT